jgi:hypothetical protein
VADNEDVVEHVEEQVAAVETDSGDNPAEEAQPEKLVISIGDEPEAKEDDEPPEEEIKAAPAWVRKVRTTNKELEKKTRELERQLREERQKINAQAQPQEPQLGPKPTLADNDYDEEKYEKALDSWKEQELVIKSRKAAQEVEAKKEEEAWNAKVAAYHEKRVKLGVDDFESAKDVVVGLLSNVQQNIIIDVAKDPALIVYALGKNEAKAKELAEIKNPVHFGIAISKLEEMVKVGKKPAVQPEVRVKGGSGVSGTTDSALERLREKAEKTGDYSEVIAYKKQREKK